MSFVLLLTVSFLSNAQDQQAVENIFDEVLVNGKAYNMLEDLCTGVGARLSGSPAAAKAVEWGKKEMEKYDFDKVYLQEVMVPHWIRGEKEEARVLAGDNYQGFDLNILANGNSVATPKEGITAELIEVNLPKDLEAIGKDKIAGKIVFFNASMDQRKIGSDYGGPGPTRWSGAAEAEKYGAVAVIIRSLASAHGQDDYPHTGNGKASKIPTASMSLLSANKLTALLRKTDIIKVYLKINSQHLPDVKSYNVIGEITGSEFPDQYIVVGAHLDSWDVGQGAHDDGTGVVQSIEVLRTLKALKIKPRHTIRAVLYMNEENGMRGAKQYANVAKQNNEKHIAAIESDGGGFTPRGFTVNGTPEVIEKMQPWLQNFDYRTITYIKKGKGGADVDKLKEILGGVTSIGLKVDVQRYFDYHHTEADTFDKVNKRELLLGAASMTSLVYLIDKYGL